MFVSSRLVTSLANVAKKTSRPNGSNVIFESRENSFSMPSQSNVNEVKVRKASSECLSATARQGCEQDAERNANMA